MEPLVVNFRWKKTRSRTCAAETVSDVTDHADGPKSRNAKYVAAIKTTDPQRYSQHKARDARRKESYVSVSEKSEKSQQKQRDKWNEAQRRKRNNVSGKASTLESQSKDSEQKPDKRLRDMNEEEKKE